MREYQRLWVLAATLLAFACGRPTGAPGPSDARLVAGDGFVVLDGTTPVLRLETTRANRGALVRIPGLWDAPTVSGTARTVAWAAGARDELGVPQRLLRGGGAHVQSGAVGVRHLVHHRGETYLALQSGAVAGETIEVPLTPRAARPTSVDDGLLALPEGPTLRIEVSESGIHRLGLADLSGAGFEPGDPRSFFLVREGAVVPIAIVGAADGSFDPGDYLDFYVPALRSRYSDVAVYWLSHGIAGSNARMAVVDGNPGALPAVSPTALDAARPLTGPRTWLNVAILNGEENDNFFFGAAAASGTTPGTLTTNVATPGRDSAEPAALDVVLQGFTSYPGFDPDHRVQLLVNGVAAGAPLEWDGEAEHRATVVVPAGLLLDGDNTIELTATGDTGAPFDSVYLEALTVRHIHASDVGNDGDHVVTTTNESGAVVLRGFGGLDDPAAYDVTNPNRPVQLLDAQANPPVPVVFKGSPDSPHEKGLERTGGVTFGYAAVAGATVAAASASGVRTPTALATVDVERTYTGRDHRADWVVITPAELRPAAERLASARAEQGLVPLIVETEDLYRETGFGLATPQAVRDFIRHAATRWSDPKPRWFLLLGDGTLDYKGVIAPVSANDNRTLVPIKLYDSLFFETSSDNWFAEIVGEDHHPDVYLGRIPAESLDEAQRFVDKVLAYETQPYRGDFEERFLLVADNVTESWEVMFPDFSDEIAAALPSFVQPEAIYMGSAQFPDTPSTTAGILSALNGGVLAANYFGHGARDVWAEEGIFYGDDATTLGNAQMPTFFAVMNCNNALFQLPNKDGAWRSLGEKVVTADAGGIGFWGSTALVYPEPQMVMNRALWQMLADPDPMTIGEAYTLSKFLLDGRPVADGGNAADVDVLRSWVLLGDPASTLRINHRPFATIDAPATGSTGEALTLDGTSSRDPDPGQALSFAWTLLEAPAGSQVGIEAGQGAIANLRPDRAGTWRVQLVVSDGLYESVAAEVSVEVSGADVDADDPGCACALGSAPPAKTPVVLLVLLLFGVIALSRFWAA